MKIIIDDGKIFDGTIQQFKDNFFSNANEETIREWCEENHYSLKIQKPDDIIGKYEEKEPNLFK